MNEKERIDWHSGFAGGLSLSLNAYKDDLTIEREHPLTKEPPRIDFLVIKKNRNVIIDNAIGRAFRQHNIIEYKSPDDALNIDVVYKCIGYAGLYKGLSETVNAIPAEELTISIFRSAKPEQLFGLWQNQGKQIDNPYPGVYYINGLIELTLQIIVTRELDDPELIPLEIMMKDADETRIRLFLQNRYMTPGERNDADAVLQVSATVNKALYEKLKGDEDMCQALRDIMKEDLEEATKNGKQDSAQLINFLWEAGRGDDAKRAANDETYLDQLMREFKATHVSVADDDTAEESSNENE